MHMLSSQKQLELEHAAITMSAQARTSSMGQHLSELSDKPADIW